MEGYVQSKGSVVRCFFFPAWQITINLAHLYMNICICMFLYPDAYMNG